MVMTLFGRRERPHATDLVDHPILQTETPMLHALFLAAGLSMLTGISEELIFRGALPTAIFHQTSSVAIALLGQAALFGLGHISSQAKAGENKVVAGLQFANGYWHGLVYLATGGDVLPCIISHFIYDWHVFMETWMTTNAQMDYTNKAALTKLTPMEERELRKIKQEAGPSLSAETMAFARRFFYAFDYTHCGSLSKADVQRAVSYAFLHDERQPTEEQVNSLFERVLDGRDDPECLLQDEVRRRLVLPEFLRLLFLLKARRV
jgi:Type II CAAX prenyl endopeptidase Rce1-like